MSPLVHGVVGVVVTWLGRQARLPLSYRGMLLGSLWPDTDFLFLVPLLGRERGHRTITHAPLAHLLLACLFHRYGVTSILVGGLLHSLIDDLHPGSPAGVAWFWPLSMSRVKLTPQLGGTCRIGAAWVVIERHNDQSELSGVTHPIKMGTVARPCLVFDDPCAMAGRPNLHQSCSRSFDSRMLAAGRLSRDFVPWLAMPEICFG